MKTSLYILLFLAFLNPIFAQEQAKDPFLDTVQYRSFLYFWELTNPTNGLTPDRAPSPSFCSVAAVGFALTSYIVGVERKYISRDEAAERVLTTLRFFWNAPQGSDPRLCTGYQGFFYHFLDMKAGLRFEQVELSTIDTALFIAGVLSCQTYFDRENTIESEIRDLAKKLYCNINWPWMQVRPPVISMGWHPETGFIPSDWRGYNEGMILYILALGSPTYPISSDSWKEWTKTYRTGNFYGYTHLNFSPLFGHQYSHIWVDFRNIQDSYMREKGSDYFKNSRLAAYSNRAYCMANPGKWQGYGENVWGLTACDGPADVAPFHSYWARGSSLLEICDDGTIAPTAVGGSIPFAPEICIPALKKMYELHGARLFGKYGFFDAFNLSYQTDQTNGWFDTDYLGIDNGPIVLMIENYYSNLIWNLMKKNAYIVEGLKKAGFQGGWLDQFK